MGVLGGALRLNECSTVFAESVLGALGFSLGIVALFLTGSVGGTVVGGVLAAIFGAWTTWARLADNGSGVYTAIVWELQWWVLPKPVSSPAWCV